jgi:trans-aconitate 2-methyltransferase
VARLPEGDRDAFVHEVASRLPAARIDYVRLNILARRTG